MNTRLSNEGYREVIHSFQLDSKNIS